MAVFAGGAVGFAAQPSAPNYKLLRYDEDFSILRDPKIRRDYSDALKFIPLDSAGDAWITLGGEARSRYERFNRTLWGQGPQDSDGFFLQRTMLHADWHLGDAIRVFTQLKNGWESGRSGGPRPTDEDRLDLGQMFLDLKLVARHGNTVTFRLGRQEVAFGSSRLVSYRESPNVRLAFDGLRVFAEPHGWRIDALAVEPVQTNTGNFDDGNDPHQKLWGLYAVSPFPVFPEGHVDLYYLGFTRDKAHFDQGTAVEHRHSLGIRLWGKTAGWDYNCELVYQFGSFDRGNIAAWTAASDTGYTFVNAPFRPRLGLKADVASGDRDPGGERLNTFNALFPRGAYFNESALIGPANLIDLHPTMEFQASKSVSVSVDWDFFWRESLRDGVYGPAINLLRSGQTSRARSIGHQPSLRAEWRSMRHWTIATTFAHFFAGEFIQQSGPGYDVDYFSVWATYLF